MTEIGASDPLPSVPARVGLLNWQPTLGPGDGDYSSCRTSGSRAKNDLLQGSKAPSCFGVAIACSIARKSHCNRYAE